MPNKASSSGKRKQHSRSQKRGFKYTPLFCNIMGVMLLAGVMVLCLPLAAPRLMGYQVFDVLSSSMEPEIPLGSVVYVSEVDPAEIDVDEVIAFNNSDGNAVVHRVVTNRTSVGEFVTKGDANNVEDREPIPYDALLGRVQFHLPVIGHFMSIYASSIGKVYLLLTAACGVMLNMLADRIRTARSRRRAAQLIAAGKDPDAVKEAEEPQRTSWVRAVLMIFLLAIFSSSASIVVYINFQRRQTAAVYQDAATRFTGAQDEAAPRTKLIAPKKVDFESLRKVNEDVVGWIYCEGTDIDFPILHGKTNDQYLHHDYKHEYNINGSVFVDADNKGDFTDASTIIYGHNMYLSGAMFATLDNWAEQGYYDEHPVMWLLTPTRDYQVPLLAGHHVSAMSGYYEIVRDHDAKFQSLMTEAVQESEFTSTVEFDPNANYIMLSTCAYIFDNARFALHGQLVPADSAGGVPL